MVRKGEIKMFIKIDEKIIKKVEELTLTKVNREDEFVYAEDIQSMIEDLLIEIDELNEKLLDMEEDRQQNYTPINCKDQYL